MSYFPISTFPSISPYPGIACSANGTCAVLGTGAGITQYSDRYGVATDVLVPGFNAYSGNASNVQIPVVNPYFVGNYGNFGYGNSYYPGVPEYGFNPQWY